MSKELNKAPVEQAGGDEREEFELFVRKHCGMPEHIAVNWDAKFTNDAWEGWQARAALAQPSPAQTQPSPAPTLRAAIDVANDRFEVPVAKWGTDLVGEEERPEVAEVAFVLRNIGAMDAEDIDGDNVDLRFEDAEGRDTGCDVSIVEYAEKAADLFEQHDRIVGELRAVIAQLRQHKNDYMDSGQQTYRALQNEIREREAEIARLDGLVSGRTAERDAALAEVERLRESKGDPSGSFDRCMKMMYERDENAKRLDAALARVAELEKQEPVVRAYGVLPPFAEKVLTKLRRFYDCAEDFESGGVDIGRHWLDLLTQLGLLNRVQRSPALWEISQQGEDLLEAPVAQAQHSGPEEFIGRLSEFLAQRGATGKALLRELRALCAAAPGKEGV
ncbi:hypothetical protein ACOAQQ_03095 [Pseudomonas aeruginosa]